MADTQAFPVHGGQLHQIAEDFGIPAADLLDFSVNINPGGPPPSVIASLRANLQDPATLTSYPDLQQRDLKHALARYAGVDDRNVLVSNGFVPLLEAALRTLKITSCLLPVPAFVEYRKSLEHMSTAVIPHILRADSGFRYDAAQMLAGDWEAILLANPQNPSGVCHDAAFLCDLVERAAEKGMYILLDEAFIDYVPEESLAPMVDQFANLIVFRSVTKFYAIPGLRVAYATTNVSLAIAMNEYLAPWPVTTLASRAVIAALNDEAYASRSRVDNQVCRAELQGRLASGGLVIYPSAANFLLFQLRPDLDQEVFWRKMIQEQRIVLRLCANYEGLHAGHFRAAVRTRMDNDTLSAAVTNTMDRMSRYRL